jgi:PqqD family protein of HPr-rel-A system
LSVSSDHPYFPEVWRVWRLIPGQSARQRQWDDEFVVYNNLSGDTHLLGVHAMHVLRKLQHGGPADAPALAASLQTLLGAGEDHDDLAAEIDVILGDLHRLALVEPLAC